MIKIVALAIGGVMAAFGVSRVDFPAIGQEVAQHAAHLPGQAGPAVDMAVLFRPGQH